MSNGPREMNRVDGGALEAAFDDGSIRFRPPFDKGEAGYVVPGRAGFDPRHDRCRDCVHYISGGGCHFVQGEIDPEAYCDEFYADYGVFAHEHADHVEVNAELTGPAWDFDSADIHDFVDEIEERLQQRQREGGRTQRANVTRRSQPARDDFSVTDPISTITDALDRIVNSRDCPTIFRKLQTVVESMMRLERRDNLPPVDSVAYSELGTAINQATGMACLDSRSATRVHNLLFDVITRAPLSGFESQMARLEEAQQLVSPRP